MGHDKNHLLRRNKDGSSPARRGKSTIGPGHDGAAKPGFHAKPGDAGLMVHHTGATGSRQRELEKTPDCIARKGTVAKHQAPVSVTGGMRSRTSPLPGMLTMTDVHGAPDAVQPNVMDPLTPSQRGKRISPVSVSPGMRSRTAGNEVEAQPPGHCHRMNAGKGLDHEVGWRVLLEAIHGSADSCHPGLIGLPLTVKEK